ncbi:Transmembrane protein 245 [Frankliniella fusca]|uniref:Transmembrane protein 245 n=1 Tax=Frankliniella fusca TaxID=407009 RepID=A0AAE1HWG6_9NEOP|nr:Transmembrane protein 245 [Frankliniella fusca]
MDQELEAKIPEPADVTKMDDGDVKAFPAPSAPPAPAAPAAAPATPRRAAPARGDDEPKGAKLCCIVTGAGCLGCLCIGLQVAVMSVIQCALGIDVPIAPISCPRSRRGS